VFKALKGTERFRSSFIHHRTSDGRIVAPFTPVVRRQCYHVCTIGVLVATGVALFEDGESRYSRDDGGAPQVRAQRPALDVPRQQPRWLPYR